MQISDLRKELGLSLEAFAEQIGLQSRGRMSVIERENRCALGVAIKIEALSGGRVNAADLCEDVRLARHAAPITPALAPTPAGQSDETSGQAAA